MRLTECTLSLDALTGTRTLCLNGEAYDLERVPGGWRFCRRVKAGKPRPAWVVQEGRCDCPHRVFRGHCKHEKAAQRLETLFPGVWLMPTTDEVMHALARPFSNAEIKWKPGAVSGNRALAMPYVDARVIQDRLDEVLGVVGWQDDYEVKESGSVICRLRLRLGDDWITKVDVGSPSEQPDDGDKLKAAFSDALKRAAVKFGIGRFLYRLPAQWCDYDAKKRQFTSPPKLPASGTAATPAARTPATPPQGKASPLPKDAGNLLARVQATDAKLAKEGLCEPGALLEWLKTQCEGEGYPLDLLQWKPDQFEDAVKLVKRFEAKCREAKGAA